jgi:hypothetical protein
VVVEKRRDIQWWEERQTKGERREEGKGEEKDEEGE